MHKPRCTGMADSDCKNGDEKGDDIYSNIKMKCSIFILYSFHLLLCWWLFQFLVNMLLAILAFLAFGLFLPITIALQAAPLEARAKLSRDADVESPCAQIFNSECKIISEWSRLGTNRSWPNIVNLFTAEFAYECLKSVPFNATVATQFVHYYRDTLQFQSTLAYLKNPPPSYQQPAVDLFAGLDRIETNIKSGTYANEYDFEADLQRLIYSAHDAHLVLYAGALAVFTFGSPLRIVSVSEDGIALPKVYDIGSSLIILSQCRANQD